MYLKLAALTIAVFSTFHNNIQLFVVCQQNVQPYFTEWNGFYYIYLYEPTGHHVSWRLAVESCKSDRGELPVITVEERDALLDDFFRASSITAVDGFVWLGADCSGDTCTEDGDVLDESLWDTDYPTPNDTDDRVLIWSRESGRVRDTLRSDPSATEFFCKYRSLCDSTYVTCLAGGGCIATTLVTREQCVCYAGYRPSTNYSDCIEIDECESNPCNATDANDTIFCVDQTNSYRCECIDGFSGRSCDINIDECAEHDADGNSHACSSTGDCVDEIASFSCDCYPGYTGEQCEVNIDDCQLHDRPCNANGTCVDGVNSFSCVCRPGYAGRRCTERDDVSAGAQENVGGDSGDNTVVIAIAAVVGGLLGVAVLVLTVVRVRRKPREADASPVSTSTEQRAAEATTSAAEANAASSDSDDYRI